MSQDFGVIVLAAGALVRGRRPKQLLPYLGKTLIEHAARTALASGAKEVIVVVGSDASAIREKLKNLPVRVVFNREWAEGIASSIRRGIRALGPEVRCAVIALCDQPKITPGLLRELAHRHFEMGSAIVASSYDGVLGAPSAFGFDVFPALLTLQGDRGARELIRTSPTPVETVEFLCGNVDLDEPIPSPRPRVLHLTRTVFAPYRDPKDARAPPRERRSSLSSA